MTNNLQRRITEHKSGRGGAFSSKYQQNKLVYYEVGMDVAGTIMREKQIKGGSRQKKIELIESLNPDWDDHFEKFFG